MQITLLPSSVGALADASLAYLTSLVINDTVAIDAGSLGVYQGPEEQARIKHILLTHAHLDHIASLPIFLENTYSFGDAATIYGSEESLHCLQTDIFNNRVWPDFVALSEIRPDMPFLKLQTLAPREPVEVAGLRVTPVPVRHAVPTVGYLIEDETTSVVFSGDTGPTEELWERANDLPNLKAVFLEVTFPDALASLAEISKHLTPTTFAGELAKLRRPVPVIAMHIKPRYHAEVVREVEALGLEQVRIGQAGVVYTF